MSLESNETDKFLGRLTAHEALLRELWVLFLKLTDQPHLMAESMRTVIVERLENSTKFSGEAPSDRKYASTQYAINHIDSFWDDVEARLGGASPDR